MITKKRKDYESPEVMQFFIQPSCGICQSPGGGGSEGTGDEDLESLFFDENVIDDIDISLF